MRMERAAFRSPPRISAAARSSWIRASLAAKWLAVSRYPRAPRQSPRRKKHRPRMNSDEDFARGEEKSRACMHNAEAYAHVIASRARLSSASMRCPCHQNGNRRRSSRTRSTLLSLLEVEDPRYHNRLSKRFIDRTLRCIASTIVGQVLSREASDERPFSVRP